MTPKKAIIIVLVLFLIMAMIFTFLYLKKQLVGQADILNKNGIQTLSDVNVKTNSSSEEISRQKDRAVQATIEKIVEQGKNEFGGINEDSANAALELANQRIQEKLNSRTPEQIKADQERQDQIQRMLDEANKNIQTQQ